MNFSEDHPSGADVRAFLHEVRPQLRKTTHRRDLSSPWHEVSACTQCPAMKRHREGRGRW